jgi:hypothetical protein
MPKGVYERTDRSRNNHRKEFCIRGHRLHQDERRYCIQCRREKRPLKNTGKPAHWKEFCKRGHRRHENGSREGGDCRECINEKYKENHNGCADKTKLRARIFTCNQNWRRTGVINEDGSQFTMQDYNRAFQIQGGMCKICGLHIAELKRYLSADHDHATGRFRGLLCVRCNTALGNVKDNIHLLENMISYLSSTRNNGQ